MAVKEKGLHAMSEPDGKYANYFDIGVNAHELVIDFGQFYGRGGQPTVHTRIVTTPAYARELLGLLARSIIGQDLPAADAAVGTSPAGPPKDTP
ncbi:MAG: hypothetical protein HYU37_16335 [Acidobacteria bacterium]|nr:hypothetical protein [Acidobacteriota bacterium]